MKIDLYRWEEKSGGGAVRGQAALFIDGLRVRMFSGWRLSGSPQAIETLSVDLIGQIKVHDTAPPGNGRDQIQVERCGTCKYWTQLPLKHPQVFPKGTCGFLRAVETWREGTELREVQDADAFNLDQSHLVTLRGFGCRGWEAKTDERT